MPDRTATPQTWGSEGRPCPPRESAARSVRIPPQCGACGSASPVGAHFCGRCGRMLARDGGAQRALERRQLSVMFCDLIGSTRLALELGAETYGEVVGAYQACAGAALARSGGYIAQHQGDGLLVYFGWPQADEDDAGRAVRAGLHVLESLRELRAELRAAHGIALDVRLALHTGLVGVGELGAGTRREVLAIGDNASLAARLQELAPANGLLISDATLALARGAFETRPLGELPLRGSARTVRVHQVLPSRPRHVR